MQALLCIDHVQGFVEISQQLSWGHLSFSLRPGQVVNRVGFTARIRKSFAIMARLEDLCGYLCLKWRSQMC